jgi:hypothetical protein
LDGEPDQYNQALPQSYGKIYRQLTKEQALAMTVHREPECDEYQWWPGVKLFANIRETQLREHD